MPDLKWVRHDAYKTSIEYLAFITESDSRFTRTPCPIYEVAKNAGLAVFNFDLGDSLAGMLYDNHIVVARNYGPERARFTVAHEIGHAVLHLPRAESDPGPTEVEEHEANVFASGLLMPHDAVRQILPLGTKILTVRQWAMDEHRTRQVSRLRRQFRVSLDTTLQTLVDMGLVLDREPWASLFNVRDEYERALRDLQGAGGA